MVQPDLFGDFPWQLLDGACLWQGFGSPYWFEVGGGFHHLHLQTSVLTAPMDSETFSKISFPGKPEKTK